MTESKISNELLPLKVHKNYLIGALRSESLSFTAAQSETIRKCVPTWPGTVEQLIEALTANPAEYLDEIKLYPPAESA
jgi:hypothetical protein